jgi:hypothetical protein
MLGLGLESGLGRRASAREDKVTTRARPRAKARTRVSVMVELLLGL